MRGVLAVAVIVGALVAAYLLAEPARPWVGPVLIGASVLGVAYLAVVPAWRYAVHRWEATEEAVYVRTGWFVREWRVAPISRIQTVDTVRGPLQQVFGLATVTVTTASAHGAIYLVGLDHRIAADLTTDLTRITQATPGDAT
ncbi:MULTISPECIES: PH domain-containing protein [Actinoalloteichus]|nr:MULTISPECIES: PH domain-containing protein [Actinoalloteichus]